MDGGDFQSLRDGMASTSGLAQTWLLPALLGLGLASATGLRTFLPLLMLALAVKFGLFGLELNLSLIHI